MPSQYRADHASSAPARPPIAPAAHRTRGGAPLVPDRRARVLMATAEMFPLAKTGGLGDVCGALPASLIALGVDARVLLPGYEFALDSAHAARRVATLENLPGVDRAHLYAARVPAGGVPVWLIDAPALFRRGGTPYLDDRGEAWSDNAQRFAVLCHVAVRIALGRAGLGWAPDLVHCHDWHAGLIPLLLLSAATPAPASLFTIHNLAFQGNYPLELAPALGIPPASLTPQGVEFHGRLSFLKAGIRHADAVSTVSPTYAREICTPELGCGMDGVLRNRGDAIAGILNGIDIDLWDPARDPILAGRYDAADLSGKAACKRELQRRLDLAPEADAPLMAFVSRLTRQKMADLLLAELPALLAQHRDLQFALLGCGERDLEDGFRALSRHFPRRVRVSIDYNEADAHRLHAGADLMLHASRFEPCGLTQQYAMRYGTLPVVRRTGGLADTVTDADEPAGTGFVFDGDDGASLAAAVARALDCRTRRPSHWAGLVRQAMARDAGWPPSAQQYLALYQSLLPAEDQTQPAEPATQVH